MQLKVNVREERKTKKIEGRCVPTQPATRSTVENLFLRLPLLILPPSHYAMINDDP